jgi:hypothetical protein
MMSCRLDPIEALRRRSFDSVQTDRAGPHSIGA